MRVGHAVSRGMLLQHGEFLIKLLNLTLYSL